MPVTVTAIFTSDIRFPTSLALDESDGINVDPDYSAAYVILKTDYPDSLEGHGLTFASGRGDERFVPTSGIEAADLEEYLKVPSVVAVGGSWMVQPALLAGRDWATVGRLAAEAHAVVRAVRGSITR